MSFQYISLNDGNKIPQLGFGTWRSEKDKVCDAIKHAVKVGYRHIDCASIYGNEKEIGDAFKEILNVGQVNREEMFITSKLWCTDHKPEDVEKACRKTLSDLNLEYLDLYLMHWGIAFESGKDTEPLDENGFIKTAPVPIQETWEAMERLVEMGLVKSIGVANFTTLMLVDLLTFSKIKPVVNQVEIHPFNSQIELANFCDHMKIAVTAYSPLGSSGNKEDKPIAEAVIKDIAEELKKSPAQVLLRWSIQRGLIPIPKSTDTERISENFDVFDFELSTDQMKVINSLNKNKRFVDPIGWWKIPYFS